MKIKRTKHQRELYELAGEFFALSIRADIVLYGRILSNSEFERTEYVGLHAHNFAREAIKLAESGE